MLSWRIGVVVADGGGDEMLLLEDGAGLLVHFSSSLFALSPHSLSRFIHPSVPIIPLGLNSATPHVDHPQSTAAAAKASVSAAPPSHLDPIPTFIPPERQSLRFRVAALEVHGPSLAPAPNCSAAAARQAVEASTIMDATTLHGEA